MNKFFTLLTLFAITLTTRAQQPPQNTPTAEPYGKVNKSDLEMATCDFEKDANAEILFDVGVMDPNIHMVKRHTRIKIFNDQGKKEANVRLLYFNPKHSAIPLIVNIKAETINIENGTITKTPIESKLIYNQKIDNDFSVITFSMPNVNAGSIIEYSYDEPFSEIWYFQNYLPTRYSEFQATFPPLLQFKFIPHVNQPFAKSIGDALDSYQVRAMANVHSLPDEPYMSSRQDNLQRMEFIDMSNILFNTWPKLAERIMPLFNSSYEATRSLTGDKQIIDHVKELKTDEAKIAFVFDTVKNSMTWNGVVSPFTSSETSNAWSTKTGNSADINMILYNLLRKCHINAYIMLVGAKDRAKINPYFANISLIRNINIYIPIDTDKFYALDASNKYNSYNIIPQPDLNTFGIPLEKETSYSAVFMHNDDPIVQSVFLNAEIFANGTMSGTAQITSDSYNKINATSLYKTDDQEKYVNYLEGNDNNIKVTSIKMENMDVDSLPLIQDINFNSNLSSSDSGYIYFNPNLFTLKTKNQFTSENRNTDIDFQYRDNLVINGVFKIPAGYKNSILPKSVNLMMPDTSITFKRVVNEQDGLITIRYVVNHKKSIFFKKDYPEFYSFYKKMYEMINEEIVLKKI
jgi:hypothetical protein